MFGSTTVYKPIIASMCDSSRESRNPNIFFITFLFDSLYGRFIILCSVSMMSSFVVLLLLRATFVSGIVSGDVSFLLTCKESVFRYVSVRFSRFIFLVRMLTFWMMIVPYAFIGVYSESLIITSNIFLSGYYSSFFLWAFLPQSTEVD